MVDAPTGASGGHPRAPGRAREMWPVFESYHAMIYFAPETAEEFKALGLKGGWMGYFASRSAPMGAAPAGLVDAVFFNFHPEMVTRAIPDAWGLASPEDVLAARSRAADAALRRLLPDFVGGAEMAEAAALAREAASAPPVAGRPLYGSLRSLPWPDAGEAHLVLWHAATLLREHRGDGHVAALVAAGLDGLEAHVTKVASGSVPRETLQGTRRWSDEEWAAAEERLRARGWLGPDGNLTDAGRTARADIEEATDELGEAPWEALGPERTDRLRALWAPMCRALIDAGGYPIPNPVGAPAP